MKLKQLKQYATKIQDRELLHCNDGLEEHGFVLVQEAILNGGNLYTSKNTKVHYKYVCSC